jgi:DNA-directed RNA polymerase specialized sigma24 family protein
VRLDGIEWVRGHRDAIDRRIFGNRTGGLDQTVFESHLSRIETRWSLVFKAHGEDEDAPDSLHRLMRRYGGAVQRYLLASLRDVDAAEELSQEFALRFLRGDFKRADRGKGRFRDFVKRAVSNLMVDYHRSRRRADRMHYVVEDLPEAADPDGWGRELDRDFTACWRDELLSRSWSALARDQERSGRPFHTLLQLRAGHPESSSAELAEAFAKIGNRRVDATWIRVNLHRARGLFVDLLLKEVAASLEAPDPERLEQELIELGLYEHCRPALKRRG